MQRKSAASGKVSGRVKSAALLLGLVAVAGCYPTPHPAAIPKVRQPFAGVTIRLLCGDDGTAHGLHQRVRPWSLRTGAEVILEKRIATDTDIVVIRPNDLGVMTAGEGVRPVPEELRAAGHPLQWSRGLGVVVDRLATWGGEPRAVPLAGEAYVLVYRIDRLADPAAGQAFAAKHGRALSPPATWEEFAEVAEFFADRGQRSLLPVADDAHHLLRDFHFVAACYDRPALTAADFAARPPDAARMLSFHHDFPNGDPRLTAPAFVEAAKWLKRVGRCRLPAGDPATALVSGPAVMATLSLRELGRLPRTAGALPANLGVAPLPGTRVWLDKDGRPQPPADKVAGVNFVPYFGDEGWLGVVSQASSHPDAAFDLLAELSRLERSSELLSDPSLGFGPFRGEHLDQPHESLWYRYGFDGPRTQQLADAIRRFEAIGVANPVLAARGSDHGDLLAILARELARVSAGTASPEDALKTADAAWRQSDANRPADARKLERRRAAGLR